MTGSPGRERRFSQTNGELLASKPGEAHDCGKASRRPQTRCVSAPFALKMSQNSSLTRRFMQATLALVLRATGPGPSKAATENLPFPLS